MLRSLDYAASAAVEKFYARSGEIPERVVAAATAWRDRASRDFIQAYFKSARIRRRAPDDRAIFALLNLFLLQKAIYEIAYESANRPSWLSIPVRGVLNLLEGRRFGHEPSPEETVS
jgi:maltose alpha-D-glucosyltransferase/alpha-amylase